LGIGLILGSELLAFEMSSETASRVSRAPGAVVCGHWRAASLRRLRRRLLLLLLLQLLLLLLMPLWCLAR
jgi:hypothetical protein